VLFNTKYHPGLLWFYGGHRSLDGRPWHWFPLELRTACLPLISLADGVGSWR
jgi:hypothetical protein